MSPSVTRFGDEVRHLDADGLLAGDRREDADLGRGERVAQVVLQRRDLRHLRSRRELQLVARDARPGDAADEGRLDPEVLERLEQRLADAVGGRRVGLAVRLRLVQEASVREHVLAVLLDLRDVEERRRVLLEVLASGRAAAAARRRRRRGTRSPRRPEACALAAARFRGGGAEAGAAVRRLAAARRTAVWDRRTNAPTDAPDSSSTPITSARTPRIGAPGPSSLPRPPPKTVPRKPPWLEPSVVSSPNARTASPSRKGRKSTSSLRATISPPTTANATGTM